MPDLVAGTPIRAADYPPGVGGFDDANIGDVSSASYITGSPVVDVTFTAPTSGRVLLIVSLSARGPNRILCAPQIFEGADASGTEILAPNASLRGVMSCNTATRFARWSRATFLEGLTPERTYYARFVFRADVGGTPDLDVRDISVVSVP